MPFYCRLTLGGGLMGSYTLTKWAYTCLFWVFRAALYWAQCSSIEIAASKVCCSLSAYFPAEKPLNSRVSEIIQRVTCRTTAFGWRPNLSWILVRSMGRPTGVWIKNGTSWPIVGPSLSYLAGGDLNRHHQFLEITGALNDLFICACAPILLFGINGMFYFLLF